MRRLVIRVVVAVSLTQLALMAGAAENTRLPAGEWRAYGGDDWSTKYSPLDQIDRDNVRDLRIAWRWSSPENEMAAANAKYRPGLVRSHAAHDRRRALHHQLALPRRGDRRPAPGRRSGSTTPRATKPADRTTPASSTAGSPTGVTAHRDRLLLGTGDAHLIALDPATGNPIATFGDGGRIDLTLGLRRAVNRRYYSLTSPPTICRDVVVVGASIADLAIATQRTTRRRARLRRAHRQAAVDVPRPFLRQGEFGNDTWDERLLAVHRQHQRVDA